MFAYFFYHQPFVIPSHFSVGNQWILLFKILYKTNPIIKWAEYTFIIICMPCLTYDLNFKYKRSLNTGVRHLGKYYFNSAQHLEAKPGVIKSLNHILSYESPRRKLDFIASWILTQTIKKD